MSYPRRSAMALGVLGLLALGGAFARSDDLSPTRKAVERAITFIEQDAVKWRKEHACATCHHGTLTVWALSESQRQGYAVKPETLADNVTWTKERLKDLDKPRDTRPGWNMVNTPAVYLAVFAQAVPTQESLSGDELKQIAGHLLRHQEADGSWAWSLAPAKNRPPPVFESDEVVTLLACLALRPHVPAEAAADSAFRESRQKALAWLEKSPPQDTTQAAAWRLLAKVWDGAPAEVVQTEIASLVARQNKDGGWGQVRDLPSDAYATGQALYILRLAGVKADRAEIQRAIGFLVATQQEDGSWPMVSRAHPGEKPFTNPIPITYFGSAWATFGLLAHTPNAPAVR